MKLKAVFPWPDMYSLESEEYQNICFPPKTWFFSFQSLWFFQFKDDYTGQDPYHGEGEANGSVFQ
jgi:uracil DNA glycosylase